MMSKRQIDVEVNALLCMVVQYMRVGRDREINTGTRFDHMCMGAGEKAASVLFDLGMIDDDGRMFRLTPKGLERWRRNIAG